MISLPRVMTVQELQAALNYGTHASESKEVEFLHIELTYQVHAGYIAIYPLSAISYLQKLWIYPVTVIQQVRR